MRAAFTPTRLASSLALLLLSSSALVQASAIPNGEKRQSSSCRKTKVAILGAGIAGITAAQSLSNSSVTDFVIVEYQADIGGRVHHANFSQGADGNPLVVEYGASSVQGLGADTDQGGRENPIWRLVKKWNVANHESNFSRILTYNQSGPTDFLLDMIEYKDAFKHMKRDASDLIRDNIQDKTVRQGLIHQGWNPDRRDYPAIADAVEWWHYDLEQGYTPDETSLIFNSAVHNFTYVQFSDQKSFVVDQRGHNTWIKGEASTFLNEKDPRMLLNTNVNSIEYTDDYVEVTMEDGSCITADYAVCTFSLGVLKHESAIEFSPPLPNWKQTSIDMFNMGTQSKLFLQFPKKFWPDNTEFFLYADPTRRGWYPIWQSLDLEGFLPGSQVLFTTVTGNEAKRVERMTDEQIIAEVMEVLRAMFPDVDVPDPSAFAYPRWGTTPWVYGSFSGWPAGTTLEMHQNLRANVSRLWFAGEHTSTSYFGSMQGAWLEGQDAGDRVAGLVRGECVAGTDVGDGDCGGRVAHGVLLGNTELGEYNIRNGWDESPGFV
ncbi:N1-acetylpolyamine oxidase [Diaporthe helianthi]|uniref:Amine oxidase n=1 Tax=Diaporthe helianthi TaxID=158607 RepID=A0A2P5ICQ2_DIAHE|nr:N1-acetylpolyamine oxidase [Diaporthe helianthi]